MRMTKSNEATPIKAVVLRRVSTDEQGDSGLGLDAQLYKCETEIASKGWENIAVFTEVVSGFSKDIGSRPGATGAINLCREVGAILVVSKGDRLSRRMVERLELIERSRVEGWGIFICDLPDADPTTSAGWLVQAVMAMLAEYERRIISERTSDALHALIRAGKPVGRPKEVSDEAVEAAKSYRSEGHGWTAIARMLDRDGIAPPRGSKWNRNTVRHMVTGIPWGKVKRSVLDESGETV